MSRSGINACLCEFGPAPTLGVARLTLDPDLLSTPLRCDERRRDRPEGVPATICHVRGTSLTTLHAWRPVSSSRSCRACRPPAADVAACGPRRCFARCSASSSASRPVAGVEASCPSMRGRAAGRCRAAADPATVAIPNAVRAPPHADHRGGRCRRRCGRRRRAAAGPPRQKPWRGRSVSALPPTRRAPPGLRCCPHRAATLRASRPRAIPTSRGLPVVCHGSPTPRGLPPATRRRARP